MPKGKGWARQAHGRTPATSQRIRLIVYIKGLKEDASHPPSQKKRET
ncbi:MAG: hypothetical protein MJE68_18630 [Proteobacteria bacterium]|nr:hypothetical protein [Pseudomonadota bacterium]